VWQFSMSIPYPTWTGACLGALALACLELAVVLAAYWKKGKK